ncbi:MAG TPA: metallophosphoesterase [Nitrososphaeraceae archaeon]
MILVTFFINIGISQVATNNSNVNLSINGTSSLNGSAKITVIDTVGDIDCSNNLPDQIKKDNPTLFIILGDLCYKNDLTSFVNTYNDFKNAKKLACLIGNHDSQEDGNLVILNQTREFCGDHWYRKVANNTTLLIGLDTNGDTNLQTKWGQSLVTNETLMKGIKNVILLTHKPAHTPPQSHHPAEVSTIQMISGIESSIPKSIKVYEIAGHNHFMAESRDAHWFISGAGGRSHYEGTTDSEWPFLNKIDYGYLQIRINNTDGSILGTQFYGLDGRLIH